MKDQFTNNKQPEDLEISNKLYAVANQVNLDPHFIHELEQTLRSKHQPKNGWHTLIANSIFPTLGWVALVIAVGLFLSWSIRNLIPSPQPAAIGTLTTQDSVGLSTPTPDFVINDTATPKTNGIGYDFRGAKLFIKQPLPASPVTAHIYLLKKDAPATQEQAQALADRFGIQGEIYTASMLMYGHTDFVFSNGKQLLEVYSNRYFSYVADIAKSRKYPYGVQPSDHAEATIHEFLRARSLDFPFSLSNSDFPGSYVLKPLAPDSIPMQ